MKEKLNPLERQVTLKQLRGFTAIIKTGSISAASRDLHLTPPAVSLQLRDLEKSLGISLLERNNGVLRPTPGGQAVFELAAKIKSTLKEYSTILNELSGIDHGIAIVGVVSTARYFAPTVLAAFQKIYPDVKLQLLVGNRESILKKLEDMEIDFAITGLPPGHFPVKKECIGEHPQIIIAQPDNEFANKKNISFSALEKQNFLLREPGSGTRSVADKLFARNKTTPISATEFGSNETIKQAVMAGMGIAIISAHTVAAELKEKRLIALNVKGLPINRKWYVVKHANKRLLPTSQALWDFISTSGKNYLPNFR